MTEAPQGVIDGLQRSSEIETEDGMTVCGGCGDHVPEPQTNDVVVGEVIGEWDKTSENPPHVGVTGTDSGHPVVEQRCQICSESAYGIEETAGLRSIEQYRSSYLSRRNIASFLMGVLFVLMILLVF